MKKYLVIMLMLVAIFIPGTAMAAFENDLIPQMTSNNTPSGIVSASSEFSDSYAAWMAFDHYYGQNQWSTTSGAGAIGWLQYEFSIPTVVNSYALYGNISNQGAKNWTFEGYDESSSSWIVLDTQVNQNPYNRLEFNFVNNTAYNKYRINVTANNGGQ